MLVWCIFLASCVLPIASGNSNTELLFEISDGQSWTAKGSRAIALNTPFKIRCIAKKYENDSNNEISIILSTHSGTNVILGSGTSNTMIWETQRAQFNHSATYKCLLGAFSEVLSIHIYELVDLKNSTVRTQVHLDKIGNIKLIRRSVIQDAFSDASNDKSWLSCRCVLSSSSLLELVTLHWEGGLFDIVNNLTELNSVYTQQTERSYSNHQLLMKMRINRFVVDSRAYGEYRCVFSFHKSENVVGRVYLHVPPILRLVYDPPPLPVLNLSSQFTCTHPPCVASRDESLGPDSNVAKWTSACELVAAYPPPVLSDGVTWGWNQPDWADYAIQRVKLVGKETYFLEMEVIEMDEGPWQVLERRKREVTVSDTQSIHLTNRPSGPVYFWCSAKNAIGETAVWWPGPLEKSHTTYWASIWWPVLGVALELVSLGLVFGFFRYCSSKRQLHAYVTSPEDDGTSFGLSRLMGSQSSVERNQLDSPEVKPSIPLCTMHPVPYTRLLHTSGSSLSSAERLSTSNHNRSAFPQMCHGYSNPVMEAQTEHHLTSKTFVPNVREDKEGDEYFWDSENEPTNDDGAQSK
ncbi:uncharacterized protein DEA37_0012537 [Paragonimus westermani]|uniref:Ig-like domain-containing protein n=1 Tax=Paragonimus westermani TaxID=34504 RepID=A0A5J4NNZ9_9TREM|nr:uncharacterized protein DEA37_0012537 [Paragonimus westermani]